MDAEVKDRLRALTNARDLIDGSIVGPPQVSIAPKTMYGEAAVMFRTRLN